MKNTLVIVNAALVIAVVILFVLVLRGKPVEGKSVDNVGSIVNENGLAMAYINTDSLIMNYEYARYLSEQLLRKEESSRADFNERVRIFQNDYNEFQRKLQNNSFLSRERAQNEENSLQQKSAELEDLNARLSNELMEEQARMNQQLRDTLTNFLSAYCENKPYSIVLSNTMGDNVLYSADGLDITNAIVSELNTRYTVSQKK